MDTTPLIKATPWDAAAFAMPSWELLEYSAASLLQAIQTPGHHTLKVDPLGFPQFHGHIVKHVVDFQIVPG